MRSLSKTIKLSSVMSFGLLATLLAPVGAQAYLGGRQASPEEHPSSVRLYILFPNTSQEDTKTDGSAEVPAEERDPLEDAATAMCSAVKITPKTFLTAGHCVVKLEGLSATAPIGLFLSQNTFIKGDESDDVRKLEITRIFVAAEYLTYGQGMGGIDDSLDHIDLAVIEVEDGIDSIPVSKLAPFPLKAGYQIDVGGYGNTIVPSIPVIEEPFATYPNHLRWDIRKISNVKDRMLMLRSKKLGVEMTPTNDLDRKTMKQIKNARINNGDSGGAAWVSSSDGKSYVAAINSLYRGKIPLWDMFRRSNFVEYLVRVDAGSPGNKWVNNVLVEIEKNELPPKAIYVR